MPKLRVGTFKDDKVMLEKGAQFVFDDDQTPGDASRVYLPHPEILAALEPGHTMLLDDGKIRLTTIETSPKRAVTRVEVGGRLSARKGVSLPDTTIGSSALTEKDRTDLEACLATVKADLAIICSATAEHANTVEKVAPHGLHILVEKPFAASVAAARRP